MGRLPFVDEHQTVVRASPEVAWEALQRFVDGSLIRPRGVAAAVLRLEPPEGFAVIDLVPPERLRLAGRHRFAEYELSFRLSPRGSGTRLGAATYAAFPGLAGRAYRLLVIGTGGHAVVTRLILRSVRRLAERGHGTAGEHAK